uniref:peptidoglycan-binding domain-containing protein n=1 Tax=Cecembia sp. TaxID=1898110 RepID=UPI0025BF1C24
PDPAEIEADLRLPRLSRLLVEQRLVMMGYPPGRIDGDFDRETRRALRRFQRDYGLPETGFLTEEALELLIPGGLRRLLE